jgi:DNA-binding CsgD family transcriptional regulator
MYHARGLERDSAIPWRSICTFLESIEGERRPLSLFACILDNIELLFPCDYSIAFADPDDERYQALPLIAKRLDRSILDDYIHHYALADPYHDMKIEKLVDVVRWGDFADGEFVRDFLAPLGTRYTMVLNGTIGQKPGHGFVVNVHRSGVTGFTESEQGCASVLLPHLRNLIRACSLEAPLSTLFWPGRSSSSLTRREEEIAYLAARRLSAAEIARELFISPRTVQKHLEHIHYKLGLAGSHGKLDFMAPRD